MTVWLLIIGGLYLALLAYATIDARRGTHTADDYVMAGSNIGVVLGCLTFGATLFSTFTLMGMPDFFRRHGVGAWIFLGVADAALAFVILWFGSHLRRKAQQQGFNGVSGFLSSCYGTRWAGYIYFFGVFVFLVPYVSIQIRGISIFLNSAFPETLPQWAWASTIVVVLLVYSELGGLKAIIYSDALQGLLLLVVTWVIAYACIDRYEGISGLFEEVRVANEALLSVPGPQGLFTPQFLIASFLAIICLPLTQPQLATRIVIMRDMRATHRMAVVLGLFAILVIIPTVAIGMYGAIEYPDASSAEFLARTLLHDQAPVIAAAVAVGLVAAAMSTADSQIFALGTELRSLLRGEERRVMFTTKLAIVGFAGAALAFAILSSDELVLLARVSFAGTALLAPLVLAAVLLPRSPGVETVLITGIGVLVFFASVLGILPDFVGSIRLDLLVLLALFGLTGLLAAR